MIEIDKLNSIINNVEREMVQLKRQFEHGVELRNLTGIQLIDRNDELCILWEKANIQEKLLKRGESVMTRKEEECRTMRLHIQEALRHLALTSSKIPDRPRWAANVTKLRDDLASVKHQTEVLSQELENPSSSLRKWRFLGGEDPDQETLQAKIHFLEERLNDKKESALEKELILEEVSALSDKLRGQAQEGRAGTLELAQKVNTFQAKIKEVTRKLMATVSELSMYQATSMKLKYDHEMICTEVFMMRSNMEDGLPPTSDADQRFLHQKDIEKMKDQDAQEAARRRQEEAILVSSATRTTAEPRVNAYIPENEFGLPKAYGARAPFMPSSQGANMRHILKPNPKPIEI